MASSVDFAYDALPSLPEEEDPPQPLLSSESLEWDAIANLDDFFRRIYKYYEEKGFTVILVSRLLNLLALGFTIAFSAFLLLFVRWRALRSECILADTCDISEVAFEAHPLAEGLTLWNVLRVTYLAIFGLYWLYNLAHLCIDLREAAVIAHFTQHRLGLSSRQLSTVTWPEVARRIVDVQKQTRLCISRDLSEVDVVARIMRKENYLIGLLNKGVLALNVTVPGLGKRFMLTKTLEWNLQWCILDAMLDDHFCIKPAFKHDTARLQRRFRRVAVANLLLAPFLLVFLLIYFFMRNAEKFYHQPSCAGARRWSALAAWRLREFNELPHYLHHRLNASHRAAEKYVAQFPSPALSHIAKFVSFIAGSFAALLLFTALVDDNLLERHLFGRNLVWWAATLGIVLAVSRAFIAEAGAAFEPELALLEVVAHTHWLPRHWRGRAHTREVQEQFQQLFQFKALLFLEEMASVVMTPFILYFSLPKCAPAILAFIRDFTVHVPGVGDICSLAAFDFERHGNPKYGSPAHAPKAARSRQGKMEKSFLSFAATYPTWEPDSAAKQMLLSLGQGPPNQGFNGGTAQLRAGTGPDGGLQSAIAASLFPGAPRYPAYHSLSPYSAAAAGSLHRLALRGGGAAAASTTGSIFASAEITGLAASVALSHGQGNEVEERVAAGQLLLQSFYEDRERALRLGGLHHQHARPGSRGSDNGDAGPAGGRGHSRGAPGGGLRPMPSPVASPSREAHPDDGRGGGTPHGGMQQQPSATAPLHVEDHGHAAQQHRAWAPAAQQHAQVVQWSLPSRGGGVHDAHEPVLAQQAQQQQAGAFPASDSRHQQHGGLLARTGLFGRGRSSSEREHPRASELASLAARGTALAASHSAPPPGTQQRIVDGADTGHIGPGQQHPLHQSQSLALPFDDGDDCADGDYALFGRSVEAQQQHAAGRQLQSSMLGGHRGASLAAAGSALPFADPADDAAAHPPQGPMLGGGPLAGHDPNAPLQQPQQEQRGWSNGLEQGAMASQDAGPVSEEDVSHGFYEGPFEDPPQLEEAIDDASGGSALTWQDDHPASEEDVEMGRLQGSAYSGHGSSHDEHL